MSNYDRERFEDRGKKMKRELIISTNIGGLNTVTPCAACKLLRRRCCAQECIFFPYFPPYQPHNFAFVHKVFGASNVAKLLMEVSERQRADTANSLVYEANMRLRDPVYGCMGVISALQQQVISLQTELNAVRAQILDHKLMVSLCSAAALSIAEPPPAGGSVLPPSSTTPAHQSVGGTIPSDNDSYLI